MTEEHHCLRAILSATVFINAFPVAYLFFPVLCICLQLAKRKGLIKFLMHDRIYARMSVFNMYPQSAKNEHGHGVLV